MLPARLASLVLAAAAALPPAAARAAAPAPATHLAYVSLVRDTEVAAVVVADARDPARRRTVVSIAVARDVAPVGSVSPDGRTAALAIAPPARNRRTSGQVALLDLAAAQPRLLVLDERAHAVGRPLFSADGRTVHWLRQVASEEPTEAEGRKGALETVSWQVVAAPVDGSSPPRVVHEDRSYSIHLVAADAAGLWLYRVDRATGGTVLRLGAAGVTQVAALGAPFARDFSVAPDGRLVFSTLAAQGSFRHELRALSAGGAVETLVARDGEALPALVAGPDVLFGLPDGGLSAQRLAAGDRSASWPRLEGRRLVPVAASADGTRAAVERRTERRELFLLERPPATVRPLGDPTFDSALGFCRPEAP